MADRRLRETERLGEVANAGLASWLSLNETQEPKPRGIGECLQRGCQPFRLGGVQPRALKQWGAGAATVAIVCIHRY